MSDGTLRIKENPELAARELDHAYDDWHKLETFISENAIDSAKLRNLGLLSDEVPARFADVVMAWAKYQRRRAMNNEIELKKLRGQK